MTADHDECVPLELIIAQADHAARRLVRLADRGALCVEESHHLDCLALLLDRAAWHGSWGHGVAAVRHELLRRVVTR